MQHNQSAAQNTLKRNLGYERGQTEPDLVAFYDIRPGNRASLFLSTWRPQGAWVLEPRRGNSEPFTLSYQRCLYIKQLTNGEPDIFNIYRYVYQ